MVEIVSWFGVAVIALFAVVGIVGVLGTSVLTVVRATRRTPVRVDAHEAPHLASAA